MKMLHIWTLCFLFSNVLSTLSAGEDTSPRHPRASPDSARSLAPASNPPSLSDADTRTLAPLGRGGGLNFNNRGNGDTECVVTWQFVTFVTIVTVRHMAPQTRHTFHSCIWVGPLGTSQLGNLPTNVDGFITVKHCILLSLFNEKNIY